MFKKIQIDNISNKLRGDIFSNCILVVFLACLLLTPSVHILNFRFKFQIIDFFIPIFLCMIIYNKWWKNWKLLYVKNFLFLIGIIILGIVINKQWAINDWFEIYKIFKYLLIFIIFKELYPTKTNTVFIDIIFICLLVFNFLHYHNIFNFNQIVMPLYCGENSRNLTFFGLYLEGHPGPKRMIGTLENPNDNAILFLIFMLFYLPKEKWKIKNICFFVLCLVAFLACQSRTALVAFFVIIILNFVINRVKWQKTFIHSGLIILVMGVFFNNHVIADFFHSPPITEAVNPITDSVDSTITDSDTHPVIVPVNKPVIKNYSTNILDGSAMKSNSWTFRVKVWKRYISEFLDCPIIGHSPQKNYFYEHKLYFDNEYVLFLWRYGILGFISLIGFYLIPIRRIFKTIRSSELSKNVLLLIFIFAICGLTNVPLSNTTLSVLFFSYLGWFYGQKKMNTDQIQKTSINDENDK